LLTIRLINAKQQPTGGFRVLDWLQDCLTNEDYFHFIFAVAFAKINPLLKLDKYITDWMSQKKTLEAIVGIDHQGTSAEALAYMLDRFNKTYLLHTAYSTFHPKMYMFYGDEKAAFYVGSNNLTPGGLETNFESGMLIDLSINDDKGFFTQLMSSFNDISPAKTSACVPLTRELLDYLNDNGILMNEAKQERKSDLSGAKEKSGKSVSVNSILKDVFGTFQIKPPRAIPKKTIEKIAKAGKTALDGKPSKILASVIANGFVIQVAPHHNGEVFLSKLAVNQNPDFFGFPFTGATTPKKASNASYPQRLPDPVVNIAVYDSSGSLVYQVEGYNLNTVYYEPKSEIRITISPEILTHVPEYSILIISIANSGSYDYDLTFYAPGSDKYNEYLAVCDQTLPSGGKIPSRRMGWL
jgi:HKD family nuclease